MSTQPVHTAGFSGHSQVEGTAERSQRPVWELCCPWGAVIPPFCDPWGKAWGSPYCWTQKPKVTTVHI